jgi:hypothetical protein
VEGPNTLVSLIGDFVEGAETLVSLIGDFVEGAETPVSLTGDSNASSPAMTIFSGNL